MIFTGGKIIFIKWGAFNSINDNLMKNTHQSQYLKSLFRICCSLISMDALNKILHAIENLLMVEEIRYNFLS